MIITVDLDANSNLNEFRNFCADNGIDILGLEGVGAYGKHPHYTASIDAALTVMPEGWSLLLAWNGKECICDVHSSPIGHIGTWPAHARAKSPALAILSAALMARAEDEER